MRNVGSMDRSLRLLLGAALVVAPFAVPDLLASLGGWRHAVPAAGIVLIATGFLRSCPAYLPFGPGTCRRDGA